MSKKTIIFAGGGTGGHFYPALAVIRALKTKADFEIYFVAPEPYKTEVLSKEGIKFKKIMSGKFRRYFSFKNLISPFKVKIGFFQALLFLKKTKPDLIFIKGGFGALPVGLAALLYKIPIVIHESDTVPGLINKIFSRWASKCLISFEETNKELPKTKKTVLTGNPVRELESKLTISEIKESFKLPNNKSIVLVLGGSQGSAEINKLIFNLLDKLLVKYSIVHSIGNKNFDVFQTELKEKYKDEDLKNYLPKTFLDEQEMSYALKACDLIISRAGAGSIFSIAKAGKPSILIPLESSASDHQRKNAYAYMSHGATTVIEDPNKQINVVLKEINEVLENKEKYEKMSKAASNFSKPQAADNIAEILIQEVKK